jgi:peroxygenase
MKTHVGLMVLTVMVSCMMPVYGAAETATVLPAEDHARQFLLPALQKHVMFFDEDRDGIITVGESAARLQKLGFGWAKSWAMAVVIHAALASRTSGKWYSLDIVVANINHAMHSSDTGVFDDHGRFDQRAFDSMFDEFDTDHGGELDEIEIDKMTDANYEHIGGHIVSKAEFSVLMGLAADVAVDKDGQKVPALSRKRLRDFYDGILFFEIANENDAVITGAATSTR